MEKEPLRIRRSRLTRKLRAKVLASGLPDVLSVECGKLHAQLHLSKLGSGTRGPSIEWEGTWLTPCQFEEISGLNGVGNWKRSILYDNRSLNSYIRLGVIQVHKRYCDCVRCTCTTSSVEIRKNHSTKRTLGYGRKYDDGMPDDPDENDEESDVSGHDSLLKSTDRNLSLSQRRRLPQSFVGFLDVDEPAYVTPTGPSPTPKLLTDRKDSCWEYLPTYVRSPSDNPSKTRNDFWQTVNGSRDTLMNNVQLLAGYPDNDDYDDRYEDNIVQASVEAVKRHSRKRMVQGPRTSSKRGKRCSSSGPQNETERSVFTVSQPMVKLERPIQKRRQSSKHQADDRFYQRTLPPSSETVFNSPGYLGPGGWSPSVPVDTTCYPGSKIAKIPQQANITFSQSEHPSKNCTYGFSGNDAIETTVNYQLTRVINKAGLAGHAASSWSVDQVALFVDAAGFPFQSSMFREQLINGDALMKLRERHLTEHLKIKLGPSLRLFALVKGLQSTLE